MSFNRFQIDKTAEAIGKPQPNGRYEYFLGTEDGKEIVVQGNKNKLCRYSMKEFYYEGLQRLKMDKMKERLRAKLEAKKKSE